MDARWPGADGDTENAAADFLDHRRREGLAVQYGGRSEENLAGLVRAGNQRAFAELVARYRDRVYAFALDCTGSEDEAGDVVCEVFVSAFRAAGPGAQDMPRRWFFVHTLRAVLARRANGRHQHPSQRIEP